MRRRCVNSPFRITTVYGNVPGYPLNNGFHTGVDYVSTDNLIVAPMDSKVTAEAYDSVNGNYIVLEAGGYRDWFSHTSAYKVKVGETVKAGQPIAVQGMTGSADGVHVHHSLRVNGVMVDPEKNITEDSMIDKNSTNFLRIGHSEVGGWDLVRTHKGEFDTIFHKAWDGKDEEAFIYQQWVDGASKRNQKYAQLAAYPKLVTQVKTLTAENAVLKAQQANASEANLLGQALIKLIATFGYKKG